MGVQVAKCLNQYHFKFHFELHKRKLNNTIKAIVGAAVNTPKYFR